MSEKRLFIVDVEAAGKTPVRGVMTEFGVVHFDTGHFFHGHLWDFEPDPDIPAIPVPTHPNPGFTATVPGPDPDFDGTRHPTGGEADVFVALSSWLSRFTGEGRGPVLVSDNNGYDYMWMACGFDGHGLPIPFGHSSRRIGDLAAGLSQQWRNTSSWKKLRRTAHDHNPVNDALGNAEALRALLVRHGQLPDA